MSETGQNGEHLNYTEFLQSKQARASFTAEDISEPSLIAGRYTLAELIVPNRKAVRCCKAI